MELGGTDKRSPGWRGTWIIEGESATPNGRACYVLDLSAQGMHLLLQTEHPAGLVGVSLCVELPAGAICLRANLGGRVKSVVATEEPDVFRVGLEFPVLSRGEQALAIVLEALIQTRFPDDAEPWKPQPGPTRGADDAAIPRIGVFPRENDAPRP